MIFHSPGVEKLGRTSFMNIKYIIYESSLTVLFIYLINNTVSSLTVLFIIYLFIYSSSYRIYLNCIYPLKVIDDSRKLVK